ncbi:histone-lysine N-methyltransferase Set8-like isoform X2 [Crassostrea virginica]
MAALSYGKRMLKAGLKNDPRKAKIGLEKCGGPPIKRRRSPMALAEWWCKTGLDRNELESKFISKEIGFGVFTKTDIEKGEFILEYSGERITIQEAEKREKRRKGKHSYLFYFQWNGLKCIDATTNDGRLGRLVNDAKLESPQNNCKMKIVLLDNYPRLCLFATKHIKCGEELRYDYGENDGDLPWRKDPNVPKVNETFIDDYDDDPFDVKHLEHMGSKICLQMRTSLL